MFSPIDVSFEGPRPQCPLCEHPHEPIQHHPRIRQTFSPFAIDETLYYDCVGVAENPERFTKIEQECLSSALLKGYLVDTTRRPRDYGKTKISLQWRSWCQVLRIPYIQVLPRKKYAAINFDLKPTSSFLPPEHRAALCTILDTIEHRKPHNHARGPETFSAEIPVDKIDEVAGVLIEFATCYAVKHSDVSGTNET